MMFGSSRVGNRWCIHPMEGWDANRDGSPSELTLRRWERFGLSGAKLIWGGEAAAVRPDGRANPNQTLAVASNEGGLRQLLSTLKTAHQTSGQSTEDLRVGLQLTHSGGSVSRKITRSFNRVLLIIIRCWMPSSALIPWTPKLCSPTTRSKS